MKKHSFLKPKTSNLKPSSGFTLIEILIVMVLITAIGGLGISVGYNVYRSTTLSAERDLIVSALEKTRNLAMANTGGSDHGLYIENNKHTIFKGGSYETRDSDYDMEIVNSSRITSTGTVEFVFEQLSGDGILIGETTLTDESGTARSISVNEEGRINW